MKNYRHYPVVLAIFFSISFYFITAYASETTWQKEPFRFENQNGERYFLDIAGASCVVTVFGDGTIAIYAYDYNWRGKTVSQYVIINPANRTVKRHGTISEREKIFLFTKEGGYDVFASKFKNYGKKLPAEVRSKFIGQWDIR